MATDAARIALFPLSNVVLFPRVKTPLHIFEPRYRQMMRDVLASGEERRIGMVVVRAEHQDAMAGDPPVYPIGCCGEITEFQQRPDGRFDLVLHGIWRFRIVEEEARPADRLYRRALVQPLDDAFPEGERDRVARLRANVVENVAYLARRTEAEGSRFDPSLFAGIDDATFVNVLANAIAFPVEEKQSLLEAESIPERYARLAGTLSFRRAELEMTSAGARGPLH
jgi:Lon protease-like protein